MKAPATYLADLNEACRLAMKHPAAAVSYATRAFFAAMRLNRPDLIEPARAIMTLA